MNRRSESAGSDNVSVAAKARAGTYRRESLRTEATRTCVDMPGRDKAVCKGIFGRIRRKRVQAAATREYARDGLQLEAIVVDGQTLFARLSKMRN